MPSTWVSRELRVEYVGADGKAARTSGVLLDTYPAGMILSLAGAKALLSWDRLVLAELIDD